MLRLKTHLLMGCRMSEFLHYGILMNQLNDFPVLNLECIRQRWRMVFIGANFSRGFGVAHIWQVVKRSPVVCAWLAVGWTSSITLEKRHSYYRSCGLCAERGGGR